MKTNIPAFKIQAEKTIPLYNQLYKPLNSNLCLFIIH